MRQAKRRRTDRTKSTASYAYVFAFLTRQVNILALPFTMDGINIGDLLNPKTIAAIRKLLAAINSVLASLSRQVFTKQALSQISLQAVSHAEAVRKQSAQRVKSSKEFLVPLISSLLLSRNDLNRVLAMILQIPSPGMLSFKQLKNIDINATDINSGTDSGEDSDLVEIESLEVVELKEKVRQYSALRNELSAKRKRILRSLQRLEHYKQLNKKVNRDLFGNINTNNSEAMPLIQKNLIVSQSKIFDQVAALRVNLSKVVPKIEEYNETHQVKYADHLAQQQNAKLLQYL